MHSASHASVVRSGRAPRLFTAVVTSAFVIAVVGAAPVASAATTAPTPTAGAATVPPTPSTTAPPAEVTWGIGPTVTSGADERPYFSFGVTPGAQANDHVTVVNYSATALNLSVYAVLADNNSDTGAVGFVSGSETPADVASWLTVGSSRPVAVTVPGRPNSSSPPGQITLPVKLVVPLNAQPGDHVGGIVAALNVPSSNGSGEHVNLEQRVVTRVYVRVSGALAPKLEIANLHASYHAMGFTLGAGSVLVSYTVRNVGNVRVAASQVVHVSGLLGGSKKAVPANIVQLLPGGSAKVSVVVHGVWPTILVRPHVTVTPTAFPGDVDPTLKKLTAGTWTWAVPWLLLAIVALVLAVLWWRHRRHRPLSSPAPLTNAVFVSPSAGRHRVEVVQQTRSRHAR